jgi:transcription elongation factor Elf1
MRGAGAEPVVLPSPTTCPFCGASKIAAQSEKVDADTYWRCEVCGEMWNLGRLRTSPNRYNGNPRWK